ncbi:hypothetical protein ACJX0J_014645, partial [Zea mays]
RAERHWTAERKLAVWWSGVLDTELHAPLQNSNRSSSTSTPRCTRSSSWTSTASGFCTSVALLPRSRASPLRFMSAFGTQYSNRAIQQ